MKTFLLSLLLCSSVWAFQTDSVYPWVTNTGLFRGTVVFNNLSNEDALVTLQAIRANGSTETVTRNIAAFGQLVESPASLFPNLGDGPGYMIRMTSDTSNIQGGYIISGTGSASGSSPAQANLVPRSAGANILLFNYLPIPSDGGASAPVIVNVSDSPVDVTFHAYQNGMKVGTVTETGIASFHPLAELTSSLFPELIGDIYLVAESTGPIVGVAFVFNQALEPSMANATTIDAVPNPENNSNGPTVSFSVDIQPILNSSCGGSFCHIGGAQAGLALDANNSYDDLVSTPSTQNSALFRVEPGNPDNSYFFRKLMSPGAATYTGSQMPRGRAPLNDSQINLIRTWIVEGAENN